MQEAWVQHLIGDLRSHKPCAEAKKMNEKRSKHTHIRPLKPTESSPLSTNERGLRRNQPHRDLDLRHPASRTLKKQVSVVLAIQAALLSYGSPKQTDPTPNRKQLKCLSAKWIVTLWCFPTKEYYTKMNAGTSPVVQWLRLCASNAGGVGTIPGQGTKIPRASEAQPKGKQKTNGL